MAKVDFDQQIYTTDEGISLSVCVTFDSPLEKPLTVNISSLSLSPERKLITIMQGSII